MTVNTDFGGHIGPLSQPWDRVIADVARRQHGVVARWQLLDLGIGEYAVRHRLRAGRLHAVFPGVYAVGHRRLTRRGHWMAAALACGPAAVLSHRTAAALHGVLWPRDGWPHVTVP